jgi:mRNA-degrading endonuclease RelE of RelBE toxin-antitoxin system
MSLYEIVPSSKFRRQLKKLSQEVQERVKEVEELQRTTPFPKGYDLKNMKGEKGLWRIRLNTSQGSFRYVFLVSHSEKVVIQKSIALRKDAY